MKLIENLLVIVFPLFLPFSAVSCHSGYRCALSNELEDCLHGKSNKDLSAEIEEYFKLQAQDDLTALSKCLRTCTHIDIEYFKEGIGQQHAIFRDKKKISKLAGAFKNTVLIRDMFEGLPSAQARYLVSVYKGNHFLCKFIIWMDKGFVIINGHRYKHFAYLYSITKNIFFGQDNYKPSMTEDELEDLLFGENIKKPT